MGYGNHPTRRIAASRGGHAGLRHALPPRDRGRRGRVRAAVVVRAARLDRRRRAKPSAGARGARRRGRARRRVTPSGERTVVRVLGARGLPAPGRGLAAPAPSHARAAHASLVGPGHRLGAGVRRADSRRDSRAWTAWVAALRGARWRRHVAAEARQADARRVVDGGRAGGARPSRISAALRPARAGHFRLDARGASAR